MDKDQKPTGFEELQAAGGRGNLEVFAYTTGLHRVVQARLL